jgi:rod shape-determining protein MreB and related proteins
LLEREWERGQNDMPEDAARRSLTHDIFISYSKHDKKIADAACATLENIKVCCWIAPRDVPPGVPYGEAIIDAISESRILVLVFSADSNNSQQVMREVERAASKGIPIIPFRIEDVPLSKSMEYFIGAFHWLDAFTSPLEMHLQRLNEAVSALLSRPPKGERTGQHDVKAEKRASKDIEDRESRGRQPVAQEDRHRQQAEARKRAEAERRKAEEAARRKPSARHGEVTSGARDGGHKGDAVGRRSVKHLLCQEIGIDLGTSKVAVVVDNQGILLCEPAVVAVDAGTSHVVAMGGEAEELLGRTSGGIQTIRPMKHGVICDFDAAEAMLRWVIARVRKRWRLLGPRVFFAVPSGITAVEERALKESAIHAGAREVFLVEKPMAAAIGAGLPVQKPIGTMIVDAGGGTTEVALICRDGIVLSRSDRGGGATLDEAIIQYMKRTYNLLIGERTAEEIKIAIGSTCPLEKEMTTEANCRCLIAGLPRTEIVTSEEIREALQEPVSTIVDSIRMALEGCPPEFSSDLTHRGIVLAGGTSLLRGIDKLISEATGLPVRTVEDPRNAVANGLSTLIREGTWQKHARTETVPATIERHK